MFPILLLAIAALAGCRDAAIQHYNLGIDALERGDTTTAVSEFERSIAQRFEDPDAHMNLGVALLGRGDAERALSEFQIAARYTPDDVDLHVNMAEAYRALGRTQAARTEYEWALKRAPENVAALSGYGRLLMDGGSMEAAHGQFVKALAADPGHAPTMFHMGWLYLQTGRPTEATHYFLRGLQIAPKALYGRLGLAEAYQVRGMDAEALTEFQKAYVADSTSVEAMVGIGKCQTRTGNYAVAERILEKANVRAPDDPRVLTLLADVYLHRDRRAEAVAYYRRAIQIDENNADAYLGLGTALEAAGELDAAEEALQSALLHAPKNAAVMYRLGMVYLDKNEKTRARAYFEMAMDAVGNDAALKTNIRTGLDESR
ncbi:MAG TPA: tetratricopeptide repeat protein [Candidatus Krumholzibacteria bacterium]|nr:tetratricopeptide repeat protein [Candidatus Krumholzibacteria bacterium]